jgi:uracil phosphoribosyltransferase
VLFPDPMGATGSSLSTAISMYKKKVPGKIRKIVCLNLIVTRMSLHPAIAAIGKYLDGRESSH